MRGAEAPPVPSFVAGPRRAAAERAWRAFWVAIVPAVFAALAVRYLVPPAGAGLRGVVAVLGQRNALLFGIALYFVFSGVARYWRHALAGERDARARHRTLRELLRAGPVRAALERVLDRDRLTELDARLAELSVAVDAGEPDRAQEARRAIESLAAPVLEWRKRREILVFAAMVAGAAGAAYAVRSYLVRPYRVLSASMLPTFEPSDLVAGRMRPYGLAVASFPLRGDVIVFRAGAVALGPAAPDTPDVLVKRVIGLPGDRIGMRGSAPTINGWTVPSCDAGDYFYALPTFGDPGLHGRLRVEFLEDRVYLTVYAMGSFFPDRYVVKPGEVFVLGDNRGNSLDSRAYNAGHGGGVPLDAVDARAQRFLMGTRRSGDADFGRLLKPIDALQARLRLEGVLTQPLDEGIARCLKARPADTHPPPP
jgi:signal peptidase I